MSLHSAYCFYRSFILNFTDIHNLESHLEQVKQKQTEARDPIIAQLRKLTDTFQSSAESLQTQMMSVVQSQVSTEMQNSMARYGKPRHTCAHTSRHTHVHAQPHVHI